MLLHPNRVSQYLFYAVGEIVLVVIGILIALQINNANDLRRQRDRELHYLRNIKADLVVSVAELQAHIETRTGYMKAARAILDSLYDQPLLSFSAYNRLSIPLYNWEKYYQSNNTYQELINSGNLALLSNDSIKNSLLDIELLYKKLKSEEEHYRFDTEKVFYEPQYRFVDINVLVENYTYQVSGGVQGKQIDLPESIFEEIRNSMELKNGFALSILEYEKMNGQMAEMMERSRQLILFIDLELKGKRSR